MCSHVPGWRSTGSHETTRVNTEDAACRDRVPVAAGGVFEHVRPGNEASRLNLTFDTPPNGSDDLVGVGGPDEGLGDVIALCDKALDHRQEVEERTEHDVCDEYGGGQDAHPIFVCPWRRSVANRR